MRQFSRLLLGMGIGLLIFFSFMSLAGYLFARWMFSQPPLRDYHQPVLDALKHYGRHSKEYRQSMLTFQQQIRAAWPRANAGQSMEKADDGSL